MTDPNQSEEFIRELTSVQRRLHAFILSLMPDPAAAEDILQDTNVLIWRKSDTYTPGTNFTAWACQIAKNQVLSYIRDRGRDRHTFDHELVEQLAMRAANSNAPLDDMATSLALCLDKCTDEQRRLLKERYSPGASVQQMAEDRDTTPNKLSILLCRLRRQLVECVRRTLAKGIV